MSTRSATPEATTSGKVGKLSEIFRALSKQINPNWRCIKLGGDLWQSTGEENEVVSVTNIVLARHPFARGFLDGAPWVPKRARGHHVTLMGFRGFPFRFPVCGYDFQCWFSLADVCYGFHMEFLLVFAYCLQFN